MNPGCIHLLLADDDQDDCLLFTEAIEELEISTELQIVNDGDELMNELSKNSIPSILFLDLNMPKKNGFECLKEIRQNPKFEQLPVIVISTSFDINIIDQLKDGGAQHYICKPNNFDKLKAVISAGLEINVFNKKVTEKSDFVLQYR